MKRLTDKQIRDIKEPCIDSSANCPHDVICDTCSLNCKLEAQLVQDKADCKTMVRALIKEIREHSLLTLGDKDWLSELGAKYLGER